MYLVRLGVATDYVTALSDDPFSAELLAAWQSEGLGTGRWPVCPTVCPASI
ncbi:MAG: hypothetical protein U1E38_06090 [Rhodospirillales bacterium]